MVCALVAACPSRMPTGVFVVSDLEVGHGDHDPVAVLRGFPAQPQSPSSTRRADI